MMQARTQSTSADGRGIADQSLAASLRDQLHQARLPVPAILYLLCIIIPVGFQLGPLAMTSLRLMMLIMIIPLLAGLIRGQYGRIILPDVLFILHILWALVALAVNNPNQVIQQIGSVGVEFIGGYLMGRAYIRTMDDFTALCRWLVFLVLCTTPFALYETMSGRPLIIEALRKAQLAAVAIVNIEGRLGLERVQASFAHPIHYGLFCSVAFSLGFVALKDISSTAWRYGAGIVVALSGFLALSSGALLAIILQIALITWAALFAGIRWRWWLLVGLFVLAYVVIDIFSNRTPIRVFMSYATFSAHNAYWRSIIFEWGLKNIWGSPMFGIGLNDWVRPHYMFSGSMDNFWLVMGVRYGIPGFLLLAAGYVWGIFHVMRRDFEMDPVLTQIRRAWVFTFLGLSFTLTTVHVWTNIYSFVMFMFGAGMWLMMTAETKTDITPPTVPTSSNTSLKTRNAPRPTIVAAQQGQQPSFSRFAPRPGRQTLS
jgi:O-antigen ligase